MRKPGEALAQKSLGSATSLTVVSARTSLPRTLVMDYVHCPLSITCRTMKLIFIAVVPGPEGPCGNKGKPTRQFSIQVGEEGKNLIINYLFFQYTCSAFPHQLPDTRKSPKSDS